MAVSRFDAGGAPGDDCDSDLREVLVDMARPPMGHDDSKSPDSTWNRAAGLIWSFLAFSFFWSDACLILNVHPSMNLHLKAAMPKMVEYARGWGDAAAVHGDYSPSMNTRERRPPSLMSRTWGPLKITGKGAEAFLQKICTRNVSKGAVAQDSRCIRWCAMRRAGFWMM